MEPGANTNRPDGDPSATSTQTRKDFLRAVGGGMLALGAADVLAACGGSSSSPSARPTPATTGARHGGNLTIVHGTGAYRHASGKSIGISGTIDRISFALTVKAHGWMKL